MRGTAVTQTVMALSDFLNGSFPVARLARIGHNLQLANDSFQAFH